MTCCDQLIAEAVELSENMLKLADKGYEYAVDDKCLLLYGLLRDSGYKIRKAALLEQAEHLAKNTNDDFV